MHVATGTRWVRSLVIVTLLLGAAACSSDPTPAGSVTPSSPTPSNDTPSSSPSPTETPVEQQIEAAVRAYYAELTRAAQTNDTSKLKTMLAKSCPCYRAVRVIDANRRRGETTPDAVFDLVSIRIHDIVASSASAETRTKDSAYSVLDGSGSKIDRIGATRTHLDLALIKGTTGQWTVTNTFDMETS
jgi:hypothetical protein